MRNAVVRSVTAMVATVGSLACLAGPAQGYDRGDCDRTFGADNVRVATTFKIETGTAGNFDFGDDFHLFGSPQGTAVVCSSKGTGVRVLGKGFPDGAVIINPQVKIEYLRGDVVGRTSWHGLRVDELRYGGSAGRFTKARITLFHGGEPVPGGQKTISV